jgi:hypothetical protein
MSLTRRYIPWLQQQACAYRFDTACAASFPQACAEGTLKIYHRLGAGVASAVAGGRHGLQAGSGAGE